MAIKFRGQMIYVKGDPVVRYLPDGSDGNTPDVDLLLTYTNSEDTVENALRTEQKFEARVLVVGGGGAGGYGTTTTTNPGGGGGGGEVIELENNGRGRGNSAPFILTIWQDLRKEVEMKQYVCEVLLRINIELIPAEILQRRMMMSLRSCYQQATIHWLP